MKLKTVLEDIILEAEDKAKEAEVSSAMQQAFSKLGAEFQAHEDEIKRDVEQSEGGELNEIAITAAIGFILSMPKLITTIAKGLSTLAKIIKKIAGNSGKSEDEQLKIVQMLLNVGDKWFNQYVKGFMWMLKISGAYDKMNVTEEATQRRIAELLYYAILAGFAANTGIEAAGALKQTGSEVLAKGLSNIKWNDFMNAKNAISAGGAMKNFADMIIDK
jgi:hypothetical protein